METTNSNEQTIIEPGCYFCGKHPRKVGIACLTCALWMAINPAPKVFQDLAELNRKAVTFHQVIELLGLPPDDVDEEMIVDEIVAATERQSPKRAAEG